MHSRLVAEPATIQGGPNEQLFELVGRHSDSTAGCGAMACACLIARVVH
jgi:hypothetical protein